jgi:hypothetical protein
MEKAKFRVWQHAKKIRARETARARQLANDEGEEDENEDSEEFPVVASIEDDRFVGGAVHNDQVLQSKRHRFPAGYYEEQSFRASEFEDEQDPYYHDSEDETEDEDFHALQGQKSTPSTDQDELETLNLHIEQGDDVEDYLEAYTDTREVSDREVKGDPDEEAEEYVDVEMAEEFGAEMDVDSATREDTNSGQT